MNTETVIIDMHENVSLKRVRVVLTCNNCGHEWQVNLTPTGKLPFGGDTCSICDTRKNLNSVENFNGKSNSR